MMSSRCLWPGSMGLTAGIIWLCAIAFVIAGALFLRWLIVSVRRPAPGSALRLLEERFARGEISEEELVSKRRLLGNCDRQ